jgi:site-specific DNA recombinase
MVISSRVRAAPLCAPLSVIEPCRAPSAAASRSVFRMCSARPSCRTESVKTVSSAATIVNSASADPTSSCTRRAQTRRRRSEAGDPINGLLEDVGEGRTRDAPDDQDESRGHQRDEYPNAYRIKHMTKDAPRSAAIYARISQAADDVDKTANQVAELRSLAALHKYVVREIYEDDDISAYNGKAHRPGFVSMLAGLREGRFDVVLATEPSRLTRGSAVELNALNMELVRAGAVLHTARAGVQNPGTPMVAAMMQIQDVFDGLEVAIKTERQKARNRADRSKGLPVKGVRPFGWEARRIPLSADKAKLLGWELSPSEIAEGPVYVPARPSEAAIIHAAYRSIIEDGASLWQIAREWTSSGVKTDKMGGTRKDRVRQGELKLVPAVWAASTVRQVLVRPRNAGILMSGQDELPISRIEPILSRAERDGLLAELARRAEAVPQPAGPKPSYLLGGILECACGERMYATISYTQRAGKPRRRYHLYKCRNAATDRAQKHSSIYMTVADDAVALRTLRRIYEGGFAPIDGTEWTIRMGEVLDELASFARRTEHVRDLLLDPDLKIDHARFKGELKAIHAGRELLESERDRLQAARAEGGALAELLAAWEAIPLDERSDGDSPLPSWREMIILAAGLSAWETLSMVKRREIVRGVYRIQVQLGGRGPLRLQFTPLAGH